MNKKTMKIAGWALGLSLAVAGIGAAVGTSHIVNGSKPTAVKADEATAYTLTPASGSNNSYAGDCDITIGGIVWNLTGNSQTQPWRIGGKSLSSVDRELYSKTPISDNISGIDVTFGTANSITVKSMKLIVDNDSSFNSPISTLTPTFSANDTIRIDRPAGKDWSNAYYKFVFTVTVSSTSNKFLEFSEAVFYKESAAVAITGISLGSSASLHKGETLDLSKRVEFTPENTTQTEYTLTENSSGSVVSITDKTLTAVGPGDAVVTITSTANPSVTNTLNVHVGNKIPTAINRTKFLPTVQDDTFNSLAADTSTNKLKITYSDNTHTYLSSFDAVTVLLDGDPIAKDYAFQPSDTGKKISFSYSETVDTVPYVLTTAEAALTVSAMVSIESVDQHFNGGTSYLIVDDDQSYLTVSFKSFDGEPVASVSSSQGDVLAGYNGAITYDAETHEGSFDVALDPKAPGMASLTITLTTENDYEAVYVTDSIIVRTDAPVGDVDKYVRINDTKDLDSNARYIIVCETAGAAFNSGLSTLDAANNFVAVAPVNGEIEYTASLADAEFTIDVEHGYVKTSQNTFIYGTSGSNKISAGDSGVANTITFSGNNVSIVSNSSTLAYNKVADQKRFRYYKSGTSITADGNITFVQLYKFEAAPEPTGFDKALKFVNDYMHTEIGIGEMGSGACLTSGWYALAKAAFFNGETGFHLDATERLIVKNSFADYYARLQQWALHAGEEIDLNDGGTDIILKALNGYSTIGGLSSETSMPLVITVAALGTAAAAGFFIFQRKRKEN